MSPPGFVGNCLIKTPRRRGRKKERDVARFGYCKQLPQCPSFKDVLWSHPACEDLRLSPQAPSAVIRLLQQHKAWPHSSRYLPFLAENVLGYSARCAPKLHLWSMVQGNLSLGTLLGHLLTNTETPLHPLLPCACPNKSSGKGVVRIPYG